MLHGVTGNVTPVLHFGTPFTKNYISELCSPVLTHMYYNVQYSALSGAYRI